MNIDEIFAGLEHELEEIEYKNLENLSNYYQSLPSDSKKLFIVNLKNKLNYIGTIDTKHATVKVLYLRDLIECKDCGIIPEKRDYKCLKCLMTIIDNDTVHNIENLADYYRLKEDHEFAIYILNKLRSLQEELEIENYHSIYYNMGINYEQLGEPEKAIKYYLLSKIELSKCKEGTLKVRDKKELERKLTRKIASLNFEQKRYEVCLHNLKRVDSDDIELFTLKIRTLLKLKKYIKTQFLLEELPKEVFSRNEKLEKYKAKLENKIPPEDTDQIKEFKDKLKLAKEKLKNKSYKDALELYQESLIFTREIGLAKQSSELSSKIGKIQGEYIEKISETLKEQDLKEQALKKEIEKKEKAEKKKLSKAKGPLQKPKGKIAKVGLKKVGKLAGKFSGEMVGDQLGGLTNNPEIGKVASKVVAKVATKAVTKISDSKIDQAIPRGPMHLTEPITSQESLPEDPEDNEPSKVKKFFKKISGTLSKSVGKMAGDMIGDKLGEITGNPDIANISGKIVSKGVSSVMKSQASNGNQGSSSLPVEFSQPNATIASQNVPLTIDLKKRLLGILKAKKVIEIKEIKKYLKIAEDQIVGLIFDLIGEGDIMGEFSEDDSKFSLIS